MFDSSQFTIYSPVDRGMPKEIQVTTLDGITYIYVVYGWQRENSDMVTVFVKEKI